MLSCRSTSREQRRPEPLLGAAPSRWGAASPALGARVPEDAAMGMMGWSSTSMAARYQWLTDPIRRDLARRLGASRRMGRDLHSRRSDHKEGRLGEARDTPVDAWSGEDLLSLPYPCGGQPGCGSPLSSFGSACSPGQTSFCTRAAGRRRLAMVSGLPSAARATA